MVNPQITQMMLRAAVSTIRVSGWDKEASWEKLIGSLIPFAYANGTDFSKSA